MRHAVDLTAYRHVVTGLIQRHGKLLIVQRSQQVGSYQLHWGGVSGFVEPEDTSLAQRALIEAEEEVGLTRLRYVRCGRPLLINGGPQHQFAVHPVLLRAEPEDEQPQVCLNWENVAFQWVDPSTLSTLEHVVPQLPETAARVLPGPALHAALQWLEADRAHGAAELAAFVLDAMQGVVHSLEQDAAVTAARAADEVLDAAYHLATCRPAMAPLASAALACVQGVMGVVEAGGGAPLVLQAVRTAIDEQRARQAAAAERLVEHALATMKQLGVKRVLTISRSSMVQRVLQAAIDRGLCTRVIVCESRPLFEGVAMARALHGDDIQVITDAQAAVFVREVDAVLLGADCVHAHGVDNKVGSHLLALAAREAGVPVFALADLVGKVSPGPLASLVHPLPPLGGSVVEEMGADEVTSAWPSSRGHTTTVRNIYFESTPWSLVRLITEEGLLPHSELEDRVAVAKALALSTMLPGAKQPQQT